MKAILICSVCLFLAGCRSEPAPAPQERRAEAPAAAPDDRPVIVAFGDSLTAGFGVEPGYSYPEFLQKLLDDAGYRYRVVNAGISGDTTSGGVERVNSVIELKPEIVILELGANDGLRGLPLSSTRSNLDETAAALKRAGAQVVLAGMTLPRNYGSAYIRGFEQIFPDLAKKHSLAIIPFLLAGVAETNELMQPDHLHPTVEGNRRVARTVFKTLEPLLKRTRR